MKIAIIGSGISGLVAARGLHQRHAITVFEADDRIGGHTHTVDVELDGQRYAVDTGFIVYNERTYPNFTRLLARLGVETKPTEMSFGVSCERTGVEWGSRGLASVFAQPRNALRPAFHRMLRDVLRFNREARILLDTPQEKVALGDYLCGSGYSRAFVSHYILPMGAAIWSADPETFLRFPAASFVRFFENHGLLTANPSVCWRVVRGGSARYVEKLVAPFADRIRTGCPVRAVRRQRRCVELTAGGEIQQFDHVILAVHSDQALRLLVDASGLERTLLQKISYQKNDVVLHTDASLMPRSRRAWASWNYRVADEQRARALVTYDMNRLQGIASAQPLLVTLNGTDRIAPERILRRFVTHHPVFDAEAMAAQKRHHEVSGVQRTHFCGAYWGYGFHEDGVKSALAVCRSLGMEV
ncbi:MAG: FAD-dependent oxidoreductase [Myxococcales bacterium]|nr:FAD-dependent oxidoreductase [Myxococcales bacterium]